MKPPTIAPVILPRPPKISTARPLKPMITPIVGSIALKDKPTNTPAAAPKAAAPAKSGAAGSVKVNAPMPGKILAVKANVGDKVTKGQVIFVLEAMKMENDIVAPQDGTIASVDTAAGNSVESGETLATLN